MHKKYVAPHVNEVLLETGCTLMAASLSLYDEEISGDAALSRQRQFFDEDNEEEVFDYVW